MGEESAAQEDPSGDEATGNFPETRSRFIGSRRNTGHRSCRRSELLVLAFGSVRRNSAQNIPFLSTVQRLHRLEQLPQRRQMVSDSRCTFHLPLSVSGGRCWFLSLHCFSRAVIKSPDGSCFLQARRRISYGYFPCRFRCSGTVSVKNLDFQGFG